MERAVFQEGQNAGRGAERCSIDETESARQKRISGHPCESEVMECHLVSCSAMIFTGISRRIMDGWRRNSCKRKTCENISWIRLSKVDKGKPPGG